MIFAKSSPLHLFQSWRCLQCLLIDLRDHSWFFRSTILADWYILNRYLHKFTCYQALFSLLNNRDSILLSREIISDHLYFWLLFRSFQYFIFSFLRRHLLIELFDWIYHGVRNWAISRSCSKTWRHWENEFKLPLHFD